MILLAAAWFTRDGLMLHRARRCHAAFLNLMLAISRCHMMDDGIPNACRVSNTRARKWYRRMHCPIHAFGCAWQLQEPVHPGCTRASCRPDRASSGLIITHSTSSKLWFGACTKSLTWFATYQLEPPPGEMPCYWMRRLLSNMLSAHKGSMSKESI